MITKSRICAYNDNDWERLRAAVKSATGDPRPWFGNYCYWAIGREQLDSIQALGPFPVDWTYNQATPDDFSGAKIGDTITFRAMGGLCIVGNPYTGQIESLEYDPDNALIGFVLFGKQANTRKHRKYYSIRIENIVELEIVPC